MNEKNILIKLIESSENNFIHRKKLDAILLESWDGNSHAANMHCNSMMMRGLLNYFGDSEYEILIKKEEIELNV